MRGTVSRVLLTLDVPVSGGSLRKMGRFVLVSDDLLCGRCVLPAVACATLGGPDLFGHDNDESFTSLGHRPFRLPLSRRGRSQLMCGIAGVVGVLPDPGVVERMVDRLHHRGPDDRGTWRENGAHLGHTRLAILDLSSAGHQPMSHGPMTITYNGEIYNFRQLRRELRGEFRSDSDTEVVLRLYAEHGAQSLHRLRGMFAFAVWDSDRRRLFAARDRLGIKPLYYREFEGGLAYASEIKALLELGQPTLDPEALRDYLTYRYIPSPKTVYR